MDTVFFVECNMGSVRSKSRSSSRNKMSTMSRHACTKEQTHPLKRFRDREYCCVIWRTLKRASSRSYVRDDVALSTSDPFSKPTTDMIMSHASLLLERYRENYSERVKWNNDFIMDRGLRGLDERLVRHFERHETIRLHRTCPFKFVKMSTNNTVLFQI